MTGDELAAWILSQPAEKRTLEVRVQMAHERPETIESVEVFGNQEFMLGYGTFYREFILITSDPYTP